MSCLAILLPRTSRQRLAAIDLLPRRGNALDLPGCVAAAETEDEVRALIREAIELHIRALREEGSDVPPPSTQVEYVDVSAAA